MNTPTNHEPGDLRYAEYVLGVLDAAERTVLEHEAASDPYTAAELVRWQRHLMPLAEEIAPQTPSPAVWARIQARIGMMPSMPHRPARESRGGWWNNLALWRSFTFGAAAIAVACLVVLGVWPRGPLTPSSAPTVTYMASALIQPDGRVGWTATMDVQHARMIIVPAAPQSLTTDHAPELWLIPAGQKPIAVGMIAPHAATTIVLPPALIARLGTTATLAVSIEPPGGSPTGQPTGPVVAQGSIAAAS
ncbi:MAG: anti-sigma factor [Nevskiaceae bacterium]|nr:MAG: anti-sigma factor [Nevskiaceae bacterium]TBR71668.1 MAG: anti-sigma factor [Nevskiaceae bacterium]